jgi:hypothetical protein
MLSASRTICSKAVPTLKQLRHFGCWARKYSSTRENSRSALLFLENVQEREIGIEKLG